MLFSLRDVTFAYRRDAAPVLAGVTREFRPGLTLLQGPSGGGKSTWLKLLAGYLSPQAGTVQTRHGRAPEAEFQRREVGFVFQQFNLLPGTTLARNLELAGTIAGVPSAALATAIDQWLGQLGLSALAGQKVEKLSGGQVQRAALARALVKQPEVLLLDEPTSGLDDASVRAIGGLVRDWVRTGKSAVVSTHDPRLPAAFGDMTRDTLLIGAP